jgi:predicted nucleic acid-binding protein
MRVVVNSSPLIALERIGSLDVLKSLYGTVVRPQSVLDELGAGRSRYNFDRALFDTDWILTEPDPPEMVFRKELGAGETAAITLAYKTAADLVILDDLPARLVATGLGLHITGTLGVLTAASRLGVIKDLASSVHALQEHGFHLSEELIRTLLG